jgi:hypothetical protein
MVLPNMGLRILPKLVVVLALNEAPADTRDLLHAVIVRRNMTQPLPPTRATLQLTASSGLAASRLGTLEERFAK